MTSKRLIQDVVELDEQRTVVRSSPNHHTPVPLLLKTKDAVFVEISFRIHDSGRLNITVLRTRGLMSIALLQLNTRHCLLTSPAKITVA